MKNLFFLFVIIGIAVSKEIETRSCKSCGAECESACRTLYYRTCCLNYIKKRSMSEMSLPLAMDPSLRLELWLAKSKNPYYHRNFEETVLSKELFQEDK
ncbi:hypothetical protein Trydic_g23632 [Trypoxylus dichotomus]